MGSILKNICILNFDCFLLPPLPSLSLYNYFYVNVIEDNINIDLKM